MSKYINHLTGKSYMTEVNAMRHFLSKGKKALKRGNYEEMKEIHCKAVEILDCERACDICSHDDFGYCGLRSASITHEEMFTTICFPSLLKAWEIDLSKL